MGLVGIQFWMEDRREDVVCANLSHASERRDWILTLVDWIWLWAMGSLIRGAWVSGLTDVWDSIWISSVVCDDCVINRHLLGKCVVIGMWSELYWVKGTMGQDISVMDELLCLRMDLEMMISSIMDGRLAEL